MYFSPGPALKFYILLKIRKMINANTILHILWNENAPIKIISKVDFSAMFELITFANTICKSATEMKKCFQLVECGKQHPIMFIQITAFDFSPVSSTMIIKINPNTRSRYLETCQGLRLVAYDFHLLIIAVSPVLLRNVLLLLILI